MAIAVFLDENLRKAIREDFKRAKKEEEHLG